MSMIILRAPYLGTDLFAASDPSVLSVFQATKGGATPTVTVTTETTGRPGEQGYGYAYYRVSGLPVGSQVIFSSMVSTMPGGEAYIAIFDLSVFAPIAWTGRVSGSTPTPLTVSATVPNGGDLAFQMLQTTAGVMGTFTNSRVTIKT